MTAGFICAECRCPVDFYLRGEHEPGCSNAIHNEEIVPGAAEAIAEGGDERRGKHDEIEAWAERVRTRQERA